MPDQVERVLDDWRRERPDLDPRAMGTVGRLLRAAALIGEELDWSAVERGISRAEGDVLLTLRRGGAPYRLDEPTLARSLVLTPGSLTGRLEQLERQGLIRRQEDAGVASVELSEPGVTLVDELLPPHIAREEQMLAALSAEERAVLDRLLATLLTTLEAR